MGKRFAGLCLVGIGVFMVMFFTIATRYFKMMDVINEKEFDMKVVSANDYTIHIKMTDKVNEKFLDLYRSKSSWKVPYVQSYEDEMSIKLEEFVEARANPSLNKKECRVADLQFGFDNAKLLNYLE